VTDTRWCVGATGLLLSGVLLVGHQGALAGRGPASQPAAGGRQGVIVFTRTIAGTYLAAGDDQVQVSFAHGDYICPRLLPGGSSILLNSRRGGRAGIWLQDIEGGGRGRLCDGDQVSVAPDGRSIVFRREGVIIRRDLTSVVEQVVSPAGWVSCSHPSFCADGRVLFISTDQGRDKVYVADPAGRALPRLLFGGEIRSTPRCSPNGQTIAYQNGAHLYLFDLRAQRSRRLTFAGGVQSWPMWSQDGKSLAYLQSPTALDGPWHVYRVPIESPREVSLMLQDVEPAPDWDGLGFPAGEPSRLQGEDVRLWVSEKPVNLPVGAQDLPKPEGGWKSLAAGEATTTGDLLVECEWGGLYLSAATGSGFLAERRNGALAETAQIRLLGEHGEEARRIESIAISALGVDEARMEAAFALDGGGAARAVLSVSRTRPLLEVAPTGSLARVLVQRPLSLAVVPDRLADDLIYDPSEYAAQTVPLPRSPFVLGMAAGRGGLLMVVTPSPGQTMQLTRSRDGGGFSGVEARCGGGSVFVSVLPGEDVWRMTEVKAAAEGRGWQLGWSNPFAAQWRLAARERTGSFAMMRMVDSPTDLETLPIEEAGEGTAAPTQSLIYAYGRSQNTPLDRMTPVDILYDALGIDGASRLLDIEGIRTYRHAEEWVPYKDPRVALKVVSWIRRRDRPGAQQKIGDVCHDILLSLQGLDSRAKEYEGFVDELERLRGQGATSSAANAFLESVARQVALLRETLRKQPTVTPLSEVTAKAEGFQSSTRPDYTPFGSRVTAALSQRLAVLAAYRAFAKSVRDEAGSALSRFPDAREVGERVRELAGQTLRKRYYLEADWLGEQPLGEPEVSYEQIADL